MVTLGKDERTSKALLIVGALIFSELVAHTLGLW